MRRVWCRGEGRLAVCLASWGCILFDTVNIRYNFLQRLMRAVLFLLHALTDSKNLIQLIGHFFHELGVVFGSLLEVLEILSLCRSETREIDVFGMIDVRRPGVERVVVHIGMRGRGGCQRSIECSGICLCSICNCTLLFGTHR
jgi:hypothetical protein